MSRVKMVSLVEMLIADDSGFAPPPFEIEMALRKLGYHVAIRKWNELIDLTPIAVGNEEESKKKD